MTIDDSDSAVQADHLIIIMSLDFKIKVFMFMIIKKGRV